MFKDIFSISLSSMMHRKLRSWLTIIGIIIGISSVIMLITISQGLELAIKEQFEQFGTNTIRVTPKGIRGPPTETDVLTNKDKNIVEKVNGLEYVSPVLLKNAKVKFNNKEILVLVAGYPSENSDPGLDDLSLIPENGRIFKKGETKVALIGSAISEDSFGKEVSLKNSITINDEKFKVIGIFEKAGIPNIDRGIYITLEDAREIFNEQEGISVITAKVQEGLDISKIRKNIEIKLEKERNNKNFEVFIPEQILEQLSSILAVVQFFLVGIAAISIFVGAIGIMNSMFTSVLERTRDIGIMKSIGAKNSDIMQIFLIESGLFGLVGGIIGIITGITVSYLIGFISSQFGFTLLTIRINPILIILTIILSFLIGMVSGYVPAYRASKLKPVDALRYE
ncbi:ABC transporter permease [Candidatus Woesearchaeota archaeon]|nr:ABC transporter permease [Candidatus Woesearchaeota archaeon]